MKTALLYSCVTALSLNLLTAAEGWMNDFEAAKQKAATENKSLLVDFTGSDWCGWCIRLDKEVFAHEVFAEGVADKFVLVELDYPKDKTILSEETIAQNNQLKQKYQIRGYPTIYLMDADGLPFAKTGYKKGGPEAYLENLNELLEFKDSRDEAFTKADQAEGIAKAELLISALKGLPEGVLHLYSEVLSQVKTLDPQDSLGFQFEQQKKADTLEIEKIPMKASRDKDYDTYKGQIADFIAKYSLEGTELQDAKFTLLQLHSLAKDDPEIIIATADEIIALAPETRAAKFSAQFKERFLKKQAEPATEE